MGGPLYPHVAYMIFHYTRAENTTFACRSREQKWYFRPGYNEKQLLNTSARTKKNLIFVCVHVTRRYVQKAILM